MPAKPESELTLDQRIVQQIIDIFGSQEKLGNLLGLDQSTIAGWKTRGVVPPRRQKQILALDQKALMKSGQMTRIIAPKDFFELRQQPAQAA